MNVILLSKNIGIIKNKLATKSKIGFIPTAGEVYENPTFVVADRKKLRALNYIIIDIDVTNDSKEEIDNKLEEIDALYIAGGNVYYLMQQIKKHNLENSIINYIKSDKLYIGASAGSCICSPTLMPYQTLDDPQKAKELINYDGLGIIDFVVLPHWGKEKYSHLYDDILSKYKDDFKLVKIKDNEAIILSSNDNYDIVSSEDVYI